MSLPVTCAMPLVTAKTPAGVVLPAGTCAGATPAASSVVFLLQLAVNETVKSLVTLAPVKRVRTDSIVDQTMVDVLVSIVSFAKKTLGMGGPPGWTQTPMSTVINAFELQDYLTQVRAQLRTAESTKRDVERAEAGLPPGPPSPDDFSPQEKKSSAVWWLLGGAAVVGALWFWKRS